MRAEQHHHQVDLPPDEYQAPRGRLTVGELRRRREEIVEIGRRYGISNVRVFGSVARDEADEHSDLDLLIDVAPGCGYFEMAGFALDVERLVGVFTQVATANGLKKRLRPKVLAEAVPL
ncbi:MAG: nucleotidyltransferase family protein [Pseudonocardiaceae bacterium]